MEAVSYRYGEEEAQRRRSTMVAETVETRGDGLRPTTLKSPPKKRLFRRSFRKKKKREESSSHSTSSLSGSSASRRNSPTLTVSSPQIDSSEQSIATSTVTLGTSTKQEEAETVTPAPFYPFGFRKRKNTLKDRANAAFENPTAMASSRFGRYRKLVSAPISPRSTQSRRSNSMITSTRAADLFGQISAVTSVHAAGGASSPQKVFDDDDDGEEEVPIQTKLPILSCGCWDLTEPPSVKVSSRSVVDDNTTISMIDDSSRIAMVDNETSSFDSDDREEIEREINLAIDEESAKSAQPVSQEIKGQNQDEKEMCSDTSAIDVLATEPNEVEMSTQSDLKSTSGGEALFQEAFTFSSADEEVLFEDAGKGPKTSQQEEGQETREALEAASRGVPHGDIREEAMSQERQHCRHSSLAQDNVESVTSSREDEELPESTDSFVDISDEAGVIAQPRLESTRIELSEPPPEVGENEHLKSVSPSTSPPKTTPDFDSDAKKPTIEQETELDKLKKTGGTSIHASAQAVNDGNSRPGNGRLSDRRPPLWKNTELKDKPLESGTVQNDSLTLAGSSSLIVEIRAPGEDASSELTPDDFTDGGGTRSLSVEASASIVHFRESRKARFIRLISTSSATALEANVAMETQPCRQSLLAAPRVQNLVNGIETRRVFVKKTYAAEHIQCNWRRFAARRKFQIQKWAVSRIQHSVHRHLQKLTEAVTVFQAFSRRKLVLEKNKRKLHGAVSIQCAWRRSVAMFLLSAARRASTTIQANARSRKARSDYLLLTFGALSLQLKVKYYLRRKHDEQRRASIVFIQSIARMHRCRTKYTEVRQHAIALQAFTRCRHSHKRYLSLKHAAVVVQSSLRHRLVANFRDTRRSAIVIQSAARAYLGRESYIRVKQVVVTVQTFMRGSYCLQNFRSLRNATIATQAWVRTQIHRRRFLLLIQAIVVLQASTRRSWVTKIGEARRAAVYIQSAARMSTTRGSFRCLRQKAVTMQAYVRRHRLRQHFVTLKSATIVVQALLRGDMYRRRYLSLRSEATTIQSCVRRLFVVKLSKLRRSAILIQSAFRRHLCRERYNTLRHHVVGIQSFVRGQYGRQHYLALGRAAVTCQTRIRGFVHRMQYGSVKNAVVTLQACKRRSKVLNFCYARRAVISIQAIMRKYVWNACYRALRQHVIELQGYLRERPIDAFATQTDAQLQLIKAASKAT